MMKRMKLLTHLKFSIMINCFLLQRYNNNQFSLVAAVPCLELFKKIKYTKRMDTRENPYSDKEDEYNYQRVINEDRARKIEKFIIKRIEAHYLLVDMPVIFPTSMIIAFDSDKPVIVDENGIVSLDSIPYGTYCVDGQHRLYSMQELYKRSSAMKPLSTKISNEEIRTYISDYKFNTTILLNFDMWEQAQVFANVNFNQKPVTKSLYYDIYGIYYYENDEKRNVWNELYLCHILVDKLNRDKKSPLYNHIKMLGIGNGYISQAFMGDSSGRHLTPRGSWYRRAHEALNNYDNDFGFIYNELLGYFKAISTVFASYWP